MVLYPQKKARVSLIPEGGDRDLPTRSLQCPSGGLDDFCPLSSELCRVSSPGFQNGYSLSMGDKVRVQLHYKLWLPMGYFRFLCLGPAGRSRLYHLDPYQLKEVRLLVHYGSRLNMRGTQVIHSF